ncbi:unnamed protein product [Rhizophagus irregularis]|nr:unnamed protein product [Rhizophagus irregularis]
MPLRAIYFHAFSLTDIIIWNGYFGFFKHVRVFFCLPLCFFFLRTLLTVHFSFFLYRNPIEQPFSKELIRILIAVSRISLRII